MKRWIDLSLRAFAMCLFAALVGCPDTGKNSAAKNQPKREAPEAKKTSTEDLYTKPGGLYTEADIKANGTHRAVEKYKGLAHAEATLKEGDKYCPISKEKANPECSWVINGQCYEFCCPPCVERFLKLAHNEPEKVKDAKFYVK
jgi:hypothetical protein